MDLDAHEMLAKIGAVSPLEKFMSEVEIAVLIPCFDEALTIERVVEGFRAVLPKAKIFVYDNASTDGTAIMAKRAGAVVRNEPWPGKGNVVRRMFSDIEADIYVMVDGDATYDPSAAPRMVKLLLSERLDMVVAVRQNVFVEAHRAGHAVANRFFNGIYRWLFGPMFSDIFSGYRAFSRRFVKSFPAISSGFEIETEISVHASQIRMPVMEIESEYGARVEGSVSKLRSLSDAIKISKTIVLLLKEIKPAQFFGTIAVILGTVSLVLGYPILGEYLRTGLVPRFPTAILATGLMVLAAISLGSGMVLDSVARSRWEIKRLHYLQLPQLLPKSRT